MLLAIVLIAVDVILIKGHEYATAAWFGVIIIACIIGAWRVIWR